MAKIGIEAQRIFRSKKHGMDMVALETVRELQKLTKDPGHEHEYVVFVKPDKDVCVRSSDGMKVVELAATTYPYWEQVMLPGAAVKHGVDLLHCTSNTAPLRTEMPLVITLHDIIYLEKSNNTTGSPTWYQKLGRFYRQWNVPRVVPKAHALITVSEFEKKRIQNHFGADLPVEVVYNGISSMFFDPPDETLKQAVKERYKLPDNFIFFLGNTDPKKNLPNVLEASIQILEQNESSLKVVIADYPSERIARLLKSRAKTQLISRFVLPGYINNQDLPAIYAQSKAFLYPSLRESFGIPILEAQASGAALVTSNTSSMPEVAGDGACLVNPNEPAEISAAVQKLLDDNAYREALIEAGRKNAGNFSWKRTAEQTLQVYNQILQGTA